MIAAPEQDEFELLLSVRYIRKIQAPNMRYSELVSNILLTLKSL